MFRHRLLPCWMLCGAFAAVEPAMADSPAPPMDAPRVLVELFTSQGCSSCPPADAVLATMIQRPEVLPLAFHVDYWDGLGWKDSFSSPLFTARQQRYAGKQGFSVYTPQMVVEGSQDLVASRKNEADAAIDAALLKADHVPVTLERKDKILTVSVGAAPRGKSASTAIILLASYDPEATVHIGAGENSGRDIRYRDIVRSLRTLGTWSGTAVKINSPLDASEIGRPLAVLVQEDGGKVFGLASTDR